MIVADRLREFLLRQNLSAARLAVGAGFSVSYVRAILSGKIKTPNDRLFDYCQARYNLNPDWLRGLSDEMYLPGGPKNNYNAAHIVQIYNTLPREQQDAVVLFLRALTALNEGNEGEETGFHDEADSDKPKDETIPD